MASSHDVVSTSDRQAVHLAQAFVEGGLGDEAAQETGLARHFSGRVAPPRQGSGGCFQNRPDYDVWCIAGCERFPQDPIHAGARRSTGDCAIEKFTLRAAIAARQECFREAQARFPGPFGGNISVSNQREAAYRSCAQRKGVRP